MKHVNVIIVGAGISGLMAADVLLQEGISSIQILDKGRSPGGRLATRRINGGTFDHGAQFITARSEAFQTTLKEWIDNKWITLWHNKRQPRYTALGGMNQLAKKIVPVQDLACNFFVEKIKPEKNGYIIFARHTESNLLEQWFAKTVIMTCPIPQIFSILEQGKCLIQPQDYELLHSVRYMPCIALLIRLAHDLKIKEGYLQDPFPGFISFIADNKHKGISHFPSLTVHLDQICSKEHYNVPDNQVWQYALPYLAKLHSDFHNILVNYQVKRWRFAQAYNLIQKPFLNIGTEAPLIVCGDGFNALEHEHLTSSCVENASLSGIDAGKHVASYFKQ